MRDTRRNPSRIPSRRHTACVVSRLRVLPCQGHSGGELRVGAVAIQVALAVLRPNRAGHESVSFSSLRNDSAEKKSSSPEET